MTLLSVNVNKVAVLRNSRGGALPDVLQAARTAVAAGCGGITVHPRPDCRHIRPDDVRALARARAAGDLGAAEFNIEGNPFAGPRAGYPGFIELVLEARPTQVTLVPDGDAQLTSDHGWNLARDGERLRPLLAQLRAAGCRTSLFVDVDVGGAAGDAVDAIVDVAAVGMARARAIGADRVELYTGPYAHAFGSADAATATARCARAAQQAAAAGLGVNAGHDLDQRNLGPLLRAAPSIAEVSIGHALFGEALYDGLASTVRKYLALIAAARIVPGAASG